MNYKIETFTEPLEIRERLTENGEEMGEHQVSVLCGLIKEYRPQKIVEVGVAAGGTTAVILNCISLLGLDTEVYSVDISERYYRDKSKETGYLAEESIECLKKCVKYKIFRGGVLPEYLDLIGDNIDFLILDTAHHLPGEMLDFLACLPKMKEGAIVVLHDIILNHMSRSGDTQAFATKVLLCSVTGEKLQYGGEDNIYNYPGMGIFRVTSDTRKYIADVFSALTITWNYMPDLAQLKLYRNFLRTYYNDILLDEFDVAVKMNKSTLERKKNTNKIELYNVQKLLYQLRDKNNIYIYGCGAYGIKLYDLLESCGIRLKGYVISDGQRKKCIDKKIEYLSDIDKDDCTLVLGMSDAYQKEVCDNIRFARWIGVDKNILNYLRDHL